MDYFFSIHFYSKSTHFLPQNIQVQNEAKLDYTWQGHGNKFGQLDGRTTRIKSLWARKRESIGINQVRASFGDAQMSQIPALGLSASIMQASASSTENIKEGSSTKDSLLMRSSQRLTAPRQATFCCSESCTRISGAAYSKLYLSSRF